MRRETATVARFNGKGDLLYVGSSSGAVNIFDTQNKIVRRASKLM